MSGVHILDILAARRGCFISDLNLSPILRLSLIHIFPQSMTCSAPKKAVRRTGWSGLSI